MCMDDLLVDFVEDLKDLEEPESKLMLIRGLRNESDYRYEANLAFGNRELSESQLETLFQKYQVCPICKRKMNYLASNGQDTVLTLQHDRSGEIKFLCRSCNTRHAAYPNDDIYIMPNDVKWCPRCKTYKKLDDFYKDNSRPRSIKTYCKTCSNKYQYGWVQQNRDRVNETQRKCWAKNKEKYNAQRRVS